MPAINPRSANGNRRRKLRARILATQNTCWICGKPVDKNLKTPHPMSPEIDEIIPVSLGGSPYEYRNCRLAHRYCNQIKSNHSITYARQKLTHNIIKTTTHTKITTTNDL
ncbi:HNH endonuclease [Scardovia wiggsiae]|uniref:HNH endonuclease n=1 Tax=Scardovia wiggsiae TaxID=230143 RepID=UPI00374F62BA